MQQHRGIAMMLVMVAVLVTGTMAVAYFASRDNSVAIGRNIESAARARAVAESGLEIAIAILETDADWQTQHVEGVLLSSLQIGDGVISITIVDTSTDEPPTEETTEVEITVTSSVDQITQSTKALATVVPNEEEYDFDFSEFAIFATSLIRIDDVASVQLWQASPLSLQSNPVRLGTLSTGPLSVDIDSPTQQTSLELYVQDNASSMISTAPVDRHNLSGVPPLPAPPRSPSGGSLLTLSNTQPTHGSRFSGWIRNFAFGGQRINASTDTTVVPGGVYEMDSLQLGFGQSIEIQGDVTINIDGDLSLTGSKIILSENSTLTLHVGGDVDIHSSYIGNENRSVQSWMNPSRVRMFGHGNNDWKVDGLTTLKAEVYAPESEVSFKGLTTLCGRVAADTVDFRGASRLLYDSTLDSGGYADQDSALHDQNGMLFPELAGLTELDAVLINSIIESISEERYAAESNRWFDWRDEPTARPHDVIFMMLMYGGDTQRWEELVAQAEHAHGTMLANGVRE